jgi:hypothetical protein
MRGVTEWEESEMNFYVRERTLFEGCYLLRCYAVQSDLFTTFRRNVFFTSSGRRYGECIVGFYIILRLLFSINQSLDLIQSEFTTASLNILQITHKFKEPR